MNYPRTHYGPRVRKPLVWCAAWIRCRSVGVPGFTGDGRPELCDDCEKLGPATEIPTPEPEPENAT